MPQGNDSRLSGKLKAAGDGIVLSTEKLDLTANSIKVLERRYLKKNDKGQVIEKPKDLFTRVALNISQADLLYDKEADITATAKEFYEIITHLEFLPNSPTLMNAGRELQQLSACFVLPIGDSMESIFTALKHTAMIHKSGGGTGFSFSRLRPKDDMVMSTKGISSGPISFMTVFDQATEAIKQGGTRRGANMGILRVDHPDIEDFITCKQDTTRLTNFNISVALTDKFMKALKDGEDYNIINPRSGDVVERRSARKLFDRIVHNAWATGEPGIIFIDEVNRRNPTPNVGEIESTNPCGEQPLLPYESCNLGSINLSNMIVMEDGAPSVDWQHLRRVVRSSVRFLDNVIDMNNYPLEEIDRMTKANRKIGLGVMGWADLLVQLGIPYNSEEALRMAEEVMSFVQEEARNMSAEMAEDRGEFPNFVGSAFDEGGSGRKQRNSTVTTIAPTGTISIIAGCSSGIEPVFALVFERNVMDGTKMLEVNKYFEEVARSEGFYSKELMERIAKRASIQGMEEIPEHVRKVFVTAHDITPEWHVRMQAAFQKYTDNAVSKTVNFPRKATEKDVEDVYLLAYSLGCKGVTVYRDGSRENQPMAVKAEAKGKAGGAPDVVTPGPGVKLKPRPRPSQMRGSTMRMMTGCGKLYVTINEDEHGLFEVFSQMGKSGGCAMSQSEAISRLISLALRSGVDVDSILKQIRGIRCPSPFLARGGMVLSCPDAIAKAVELYIKGKTEKPPVAEEATTLKDFEEKTTLENVVGVCPDCGNAVGYEEGCMLCRFCGWSKCG